MKKILSVVVVFVLLVAMSVSAFAAAPTTAQNKEDGSWTTAGSDAAYANSMMTILAYTEGQAISVDSIQYIDQTTADSTGAYSFANYLPKVNPTTAKYVVKVGGQNVVNGPLDAGYIEAAANDVTVTGTVKQANTTAGATVALYNGETEVVKATSDVSTGAFTLTAPAGTYTLKITQLGHTSYVYNNVDIATLAAGAEYVLYGGEVTGDDVIGVPDVSAVIGALKKEVTDANRVLDVTGDSAIGVPDVSTTIGNLKKEGTVLPVVETPAE